LKLQEITFLEVSVPEQL